MQEKYEDAIGVSESANGRTIANRKGQKTNNGRKI